MVSAMSRTTAAFARPPSGGAVTWIFQPSPCLPTMRARVAPGDTRRCNRAGFTSVSLALRGLDPGRRDVVLDGCKRRAQERAPAADLAEQPVVIGARVTRDRPSLRPRFLDNEIRLLAGLLLERDRSLLGGDERRSQQALELAVAHEVRFELLDLVREVGAFTPDV